MAEERPANRNGKNERYDLPRADSAVIVVVPARAYACPA
jgi:hypothetical protein